MKFSHLSFLCATSLMASGAQAATSLSVTSSSFADNRPIAPRYAYCAPDGAGKTRDGGNVSPQLSWSGAPQGTKSYALIAVDPDVPANFDNANKEGQTIAADAPRQDFYHWILLDIPASVTSLPEGKDSQKVIKGGKPVGKTAYGSDSRNDYAKFYGGSHGGYDGPCPPWNDERVHHYHFIVSALDVDSLGLDAGVTGKQAQDAIAKHMIAQGELVGTYTQNAKLGGK